MREALRREEVDELIDYAIKHSKGCPAPRTNGEKYVNIRAIIERFEADDTKTGEDLYGYAIDILNRIVARSATLLQLNGLLIASILFVVSPQVRQAGEVTFRTVDVVWIFLSLVSLLLLLASSFLTIFTIRIVWDYPETLKSGAKDFAATQVYNAVRAVWVNRAVNMTTSAIAIFLLSLIFWVIGFLFR